MPLPVLLRDLDISTLAAAGSARPPFAVDIDSVEGLNADAAAVRFVVDELGITTVLTRRPAVAAAVAAVGGLALLRVFAFDSTGLDRALDTNPRGPRVGTVVSPGPVLCHLGPADLARLPRPLVAYGLVATADVARAILDLADAVIVRADCARGLLAIEPGLVDDAWWRVDSNDETPLAT